jgi:hypothetical protein
MSKVDESYFKRYMSISQDSIICYNKINKSSSKPKVKDISKMNLKKAYKSDTLTKNSAKKIKKILTHWILAINMSQADNKNKFKKKRRYLVMLTLTLPAVQAESDKEIKRNYLNNYLIQLKRKYKEVNYLWVAEKQKNGNIHFHIILDNWVHKQWCSDVWNKVLANGCYIDNFEKKYNHRNPPSTQVQGQKNMGSPANYLTKYVTKAENTMPIDGVKWSCSKELLEICNVSFYCKDWYCDYLYYYRNELKVKYWQNDFVEVYYFDKFFLNEFLYNDLFLDNERYFRSIYSKLYPELSNTKYDNLSDKKDKSVTADQLALPF